MRVWCPSDHVYCQKVGLPLPGQNTSLGGMSFTADSACVTSCLVYCGLGLCDVLSCDLYQCDRAFGDFFGPAPFFLQNGTGMQVFREHTERRGSGLRLPSHSQDSSGTQCQTTFRGTGARRKKYEASVILISRTRRLIGGRQWAP